MGNRGPIPKPTVVEMMEGRPGHRRINSNEPQPRNVAPKCPEHLDARAKKEWQRLVPILLRMRLLTKADGIALETLCQTYSTMLKAQEKLHEVGILYKSPSGYVMQSPAVEHRRRVCRYANQAIERVRPDAGIAFPTVYYCV